MTADGEFCVTGDTSPVAYRTCSVRAVTTTPAGRSSAHLAHFPDRGCLPSYYGQSAPASTFSGPAQCSLSLRPARFAALLTEDFSRSISDHSLPPDPPQVLPAGTRVAGWASHPLIPHALAGHAQQSSRERHPPFRCRDERLVVLRHAARSTGKHQPLLVSGYVSRHRNQSVRLFRISIRAPGRPERRGSRGAATVEVEREGGVRNQSSHHLQRIDKLFLPLEPPDHTPSRSRSATGQSATPTWLIELLPPHCQALHATCPLRKDPSLIA